MKNLTRLMGSINLQFMYKSSIRKEVFIPGKFSKFSSRRGEGGVGLCSAKRCSGGALHGRVAPRAGAEGREGERELSEGPTGERDSALTICQPAASANTHMHTEKETNLHASFCLHAVIHTKVHSLMHLRCV